MGTIIAIIVIILIVSTLNVVCFLIGAKVGQTVVKGDPIELPNLNPLEAIRKHRERVEAEKESDRLETILENIAKYDGTGIGQKDVR